MRPRSPGPVALLREPQGERRRPTGSSEPERVEPFLSDAASYPGGHSQRVCFPRTEAEVAAELQASPSVLCIGAQSSLTGGATPRGECVLSTKHFDDVRIDGPLHATVGAGVPLRTLREHLDAAGLNYPPVPTYDGATIGGTVATNAAGAATFKHGTTRDWVDRLVVVLANGRVLDLHRGDVVADARGHFLIDDGTGSRIDIARPAITMPAVPKVSCGYFSRPGMDLLDLFIGSEGNLGIVTRVGLRLRPRVATLSALVPVGSEEAAMRLVGDLRAESRRTRNAPDASGLDIAAIEYIDGACIDLLLEDQVFDSAGIKIERETRALLFLEVELPTARHDDLDAPLARLGEILDRHGRLDSTSIAQPHEAAKQLALRALREAVPEGVNRRIRDLQRTSGDGVSKAAADVIVPFDRLPEALLRYRDIARRAGLKCLIWGHVSDANVHPNLLPRSPEDAARARQALLEIGRAAIELGGAPMSEHGVGRNPIKQQLLLDVYGHAGVESMRAVKRALDPSSILSPGSIFPT